MKAALLVVIVLLAMGGLYVLVMTPNLPASTLPVQSFSASSSGSVWWVGASSTDSSALPNMGVRGIIQVISMSVVGCLSFWVSDDLSDSIWGQVGYYICNTSTPVAFYQIWNLNTNTVLTTGTASVSTGSHTFSMYLQSGTTWAYSLDGTVFGTYDMGASSSSSSYPVYALSEEEASSTFTFPKVTFSTALQVMKSESWSPVQTANSYGTSWGVAGEAQGTGLQADQITVGGSLGVLPQGTQLWSTGTASTTSSSSASKSSSTSTSSTATLPPVTSTVTRTATSTATSTVTSTTAKTTTSTVTSPTTITSTVTTTRTSTGTVTSLSTVTSPPTTTTQTVTKTSTVTPSTATATQTSTGTVTSVSTVTLPQTTTTANQITTTTNTQTVTSTLMLNHTSTSTTISTSIQPATVTETTSSQVTTTATNTVPSTVTVTWTLSGTPAASTTCSNGTGSLSNPCPSTGSAWAALSSIVGGSTLAILAMYLTGLALVVRRRTSF